MCRMCIVSHITDLLDDVKAQVVSPKTEQLRMEIRSIKMCVPIPTNRVAVAPYKRIYMFPGTSTSGAVAFVRMVRLLDLILANLEADKVVTTRDLYYMDVTLFRDQRNVVRSIETLTRLLRIPRSELGIMPSPNGLLAGDLTIALDNGEIVEVKRSNGATLIPVQNIMYVSAQRVPDFILVVEKEAVFSYLQWELPEAIVITGRGFPDRATRNLVKALNVTYPEVPVYGLVDSDPHGILICRNYECGSTLTVEKQDVIPIQYLGVSLLEYSTDLVPSTINDLKLSVSTLKKHWIHLPENEPYKIELQRGIFMSMKGEMNLLDRDHSHRLSKYIQDKVELAKRQGQASVNVTNWSQPRLIDHLSYAVRIGSHRGDQRQLDKLTLPVRSQDHTQANKTRTENEHPSDAVRL